MLDRHNDVGSADPTPCFPFGHGLSYTSFSWDGLQLDGAAPGDAPLEVRTDGVLEISCTVRNDGARAGTEVVQLYLHDPFASVVRPVRSLVGFARVDLEPGQVRRVRFGVHADRTSFTGRDLRRVVEAGDLVLQLGASSEDLRLDADVRLVGPDRVVGADRVLSTSVVVEEAAVGPIGS